MAALFLGLNAMSETAEERAIPPAAQLRIEQSVGKLQAEMKALPGARVPRYADFDLAWPASDDEAAAMGGNAVIMITVLDADPSELPVARAYVRAADGQVTSLHAIRNFQRQIPKTSIAVSMVGENVEFAFFLMPLNLARGHGRLLIDFAKNRTGFGVVSLPLQPPLYLSPRPARVFRSQRCFAERYARA